MGRIIATIIVIGIAYLIYEKRRKKPKPAPRKKLPWELGRPLYPYFAGVTRPSIDTRYGNDFSLNDIEFYRLNAVRQSGTPENVFFNLPNPKHGKHEGHDWKRIINVWRKEGNIHILGEYNPEYLQAVRLWCEEANKRGIVYIYSLFDACGLKDSSVNHWAYKHFNNKGIDGGHVEKFLRTNGACWQYQCMLADKILETVGEFPNLVLELCNEPYSGAGSVRQWHADMMSYIVRRKHEMGYDHVKISINAANREYNNLSPEFIFVHWQNNALSALESVQRNINPDGYGNFPGKGGQSTDTGTFRGQDFPWDEYTQKAIDLGISLEYLIIDFPDHNYWKVKNTMEANYIYDR
jgi:hypothetical protein